MQHMKTIHIPEATREIVDFVTCDLCGRKIENRSFAVNEVEVRHTTGSSYPEGGSGEEVVVDMCGTSFNKKLIPWLATQGAKPKPVAWDW